MNLQIRNFWFLFRGNCSYLLEEKLRPTAGENIIFQGDKAESRKCNHRFLLLETFVWTVKPHFKQLDRKELESLGRRPTLLALDNSLQMLIRTVLRTDDLFSFLYQLLFPQLQADTIEENVAIELQWAPVAV